MTKEEIYQKVVDIILDTKGDNFAVAPETSLNDDIAADSVEVMEFVLSIEDEFGIEISDAAIEEFQTVEDITRYIVSLKK